MWWFLLIAVYLGVTAWFWCELRFIHDTWRAPLVLAVLWPVWLGWYVVECLVEAAGEGLLWLWKKGRKWRSES